MPKPETVEDYLRAIPRDDFREELERVRALIMSEIPDAQEVISYGIPAFKLEKVVVWLAAFQSHISFCAGGGTGIFAQSLAGFKASKGAVQFTPDNPLPDEWVRKVVRARVLETRSS
ncbi:MAG: DUF1801 domain-containing protein [Fimbriimonadaceae bacterium]|nr:DUF1801 domain-containing protein [Fimbriimonadaceae bacterium]